MYEIYLGPHVAWTPCFMIFRPFVGLPVMCIPNISPRINSGFAERVCERHNLARVITEILGTHHRAFRQPGFEQNLDGFWHCASRLIWGKCPRGATWWHSIISQKRLTHDQSMDVSLNPGNKIDAWTALLERCHSYPRGTSIRVGSRSKLMSPRRRLKTGP